MQTDGHVFFELYVSDLRWYVALFKDALGLVPVEEDEDFVKLKSRHGTVLLNGMDDLPEGHPFRGFKDAKRATPRGFGIELGLVIDDLAAAHERARAFAVGLVSDVTVQEWGMSDFRIATKEGYFLRVTTSDPEEPAPPG